MIIDILKNNDFIQTNTGDGKGTIWASKNTDPELNKGKINVSKVLGFRANTDENANLGAPASGFAFSSTAHSSTKRYYAVADDRVWYSVSNNPDSGWEEITSTPTDCDLDSDIIDFNSKIYVATNNYLKKWTSGAGWGNINAISAAPHSMTVYANRLYVSDGDNIESMNTAETYVTSGSYTIDLASTTGTSQLITKIASVSDGIWIATLFTNLSSGEMIFWDGVTENVASARYKIPRGALAMTIKDDRPYIIDSSGKTRVFDGTTFVEIGRLPLSDEELFGFNDTSNERWVHPNGMIVVGDEIYILVNNTRNESSYDVIERMPAGIWAWNKDLGLYHKYSFSQIDLSGPTVTDYGAFNLAQTGALFRADTTGGNAVDRIHQSEVLAGIKYYSDATTTKAAIGITDVANTIKKAGYFVTAQIGAEEVGEQWQKIVALYDRFKNSTDKIIIKYRTSEDSPIYATGTWSADDILRSSNDLSSVENGDEIEVLQGVGAGLCTHIKSITNTYRIVIDETITGMSGTCKFRVQKWSKIGDIADMNGTFESMKFEANASAWIQFKVFIIGTGRSPQLNRIVSVSAKSESY